MNEKNYWFLLSLSIERANSANSDGVHALRMKGSFNKSSAVPLFKGSNSKQRFKKFTNSGDHFDGSRTVGEGLVWINNKAYIH